MCALFAFTHDCSARYVLLLFVTLTLPASSQECRRQSYSGDAAAGKERRERDQNAMQQARRMGRQQG